jgi:hypothetical protein
LQALADVGDGLGDFGKRISAQLMKLCDACNFWNQNEPGVPSIIHQQELAASNVA